MSQGDACSSSNHRNRLSWSQSIEGRYGNGNSNSSYNSQPSQSCCHSNNSQSDHPTTQQSSADILTQTADLTQLGDFDDESSAALSPLPPFSPTAQRKLPWGRLMPCRHDAPKAVDFYPREPSERDNRYTTGTPGVYFLGLSNLHPSQIFNVYTLGRSSKADVPAAPPDESLQLQDSMQHARLTWAYGMISNKHCFIYSQITTTSSAAAMEVYVEDTSGNGTLINKTTLLKKGEKRLLHSGDEICLVNPVTLRKKIRNPAVLNEILQQHSYIFVNLLVQQQQSAFGAAIVRGQQQPRVTMPPASSRLSMPPSSSKRRPAVDPRAIRPHPGAHPNNNNGRLLPAAPYSATASPMMAARTANSSTARRVELDYDIRDLLGTGTVGQVRRAIHRKTGVERAIKIISLQQRQPNTFTAATNKNLNNNASTTMFQAEAAILQGLDHPYIVKLIEYYVSPTAVHLVFELCVGGDLFDRIILKTKYSETQARRVMRRLLAAIYYLHEEKLITHRDLKPENILLLSKDNDVDIQLTDFGLAKTVSSDGLKTFCGTPMYFAPEILQRRHTVMGQGRYGKEADMWSLGIILYILLTGVPPFDPDSRDTTIKFETEHWVPVSMQAQTFVRQLLVIDPKSRLTVAQACVNEWILEEDGDTHRNPLHDPRLELAPQKRLFDSQLSGVDDCQQVADHDIGLPIDDDNNVNENNVVVSSPIESKAGEDVKTKEAADSDSENASSVDEAAVPAAHDSCTDGLVTSASPEKASKIPKVSLGGNLSDTNETPSRDNAAMVRVRPPLESLFPAPTNKSIVSSGARIAISPSGTISLKTQPVLAAAALPNGTMKSNDELVEDEIMSDFSDKTESISSFEDVQKDADGSAVAGGLATFASEPLLMAASKKPTDRKTKVAKGNVVATKKRRRTESKPATKSDKTKNAASKVKLRGTKKSKSAGSSTSNSPQKLAAANDENGRQTTLSNFFAKRT